MLTRKIRVVLLRLVFVPLVFALLFVGWRWSYTSVTGFVLEWIGYLLMVAGIGLRLWSVCYIGGRKSKELITEGPYSICRNPLYLGTLSIVIGASLCLDNIVMAILGVVVIIPVNLFTVLAEERHLSAIFEQDYEEYKRRVPRFIPTFRRYKGIEVLAIPSRIVRRIALEVAGVLLIPFLSDLVELLHDKHVLPVLWRFP